MKKMLLILLIMSFCALTFAQEICNCPQQTKQGKGTFYFTGGYNFDWFAKGTMHFEDHTTNNYDFTLYDVKAVDKKEELKNILHEDITIPQYSFRIGYWFNNKRDLGIELNYDHAKYKVLRNQTLHLKGQIHGKEYDLDTLVTSSFLKFEHSNGANFCVVNIIKRQNLLHNRNKKLWLGAVFKYGFGFVYPRTDVTIFGISRNDKYHVAGYVTALETGFRFDLFKYFFLETTLKGVFANYNNVLLPGDGRAKHKVYGVEYIALCGLQFPL